MCSAFLTTENTCCSRADQTSRSIRRSIHCGSPPPIGGTTGEIDLMASNVIHFADWLPGSSTVVAFSTVEPRSNAPGWQANNDLQRITVGGKAARILDSQSGGIYGWWGTSFAFSLTGRLAYARPDGVGIVIQDGGYLAPILKVTPLQTHGDWAWTPGRGLGIRRGNPLYRGTRSCPAPTPAEESPVFDLKAISLSTNTCRDTCARRGHVRLPERLTPESRRIRLGPTRSPFFRRSSRNRATQAVTGSSSWIETGRIAGSSFLRKTCPALNLSGSSGHPTTFPVRRAPKFAFYTRAISG